MVSHDQPRTTLVLRLLGQGSLMYCLCLMMGLRFLIQEQSELGVQAQGKPMRTQRPFSLGVDCNSDQH